MAQHLELGESSFGGCEIWFSQHRWHVSEYVVFFKGSRYLPFSERQTDPALTFRPVSKGYRSHLLRTFPLSTLNFYNISVSNKHDGGKKKSTKCYCYFLDQYLISGTISFGTSAIWGVKVLLKKKKSLQMEWDWPVGLLIIWLCI